MSKRYGYTRDLKKSTKQKIKKRIEKIEEQKRELKLNYNDFPYESTANAILRRENEIAELNEFYDIINGFDAKQLEIDDYRIILKKVLILLENSEEWPQNITKAEMIIRCISGIETLELSDSQFEIKAKHGGF